MSAEGRMQRKNYKDLDENEAEKIRNCFEVLQSRTPQTFNVENPGERIKEIYEVDPQEISFWDLARIHTDYCAHHQVKFLIWHRVYIHMFEEAMRTVDASVSLPYYDPKESGDDEFLPDFFKSNNSVSLYTYPFDLVHRGVVVSNQRSTTRNTIPRFTDRRGNVYETKQVLIDAFNQTLSADTFSEISYYRVRDGNGNISSRTDSQYPIETPHDWVHAYGGNGQVDPQNSNLVISGDFGIPETAAFDPIFWFHHCNIERYFVAWQTATGFNNMDKIKENWGISPIYDDDNQFDGNIAGFDPEKFNWLDVAKLDFIPVEYDILPSRQSVQPELVRNLGTFAMRRALPEEEKVVTVKNLEASAIIGTFTVHVDGKLGERVDIDIFTKTHFNRVNPKTCPSCKDAPYISFYFPVKTHYDSYEVVVTQNDKEIDPSVYNEKMELNVLSKTDFNLE